MPGGEPENGESPGEVTRLLGEIRSGHQDAAERLIPLVYQELRKLAGAYLRRERPDATLRATALVHEAYLRLVGHEQNLQNRTHFFAVAARVMRRILIDHAKSRRALKRGGAVQAIPLEDVAVFTPEQSIELLALNEALDRLEEFDPRQSRIVELRYFGGLTDEETGEVLGISSSTVKRDWKLAQAWLYNELAGSNSGVKPDS